MNADEFHMKILKFANNMRNVRISCLSISIDYHGYAEDSTLHKRKGNISVFYLHIVRLVGMNKINISNNGPKSLSFMSKSKFGSPYNICVSE